VVRIHHEGTTARPTAKQRDR